MNISLRFFAATAEAVQARTKQVELSDGARIAHLNKFVIEQFPTLKNLRLIYAVNEEYVSLDSPLNEDDEVAVFTPVSGG